MKALPVINRTEYGFERTTCSCEKCARFCLYLPGALSVYDLPRLTEARGYPNPFAYGEAELTASPGSVAFAQGRLIRIRNLVPRSRPDGSCIYFENQLCSIHAVSPYSCSFFDDHMNGPEGDRRMQPAMFDLLKDYQLGGVYSQVWERLWNLGIRGVDRWPEKRTELWKEAMYTVAYDKDERRRSGAMRILTTLTVGRIYGDVPQ